jgi:predicted permease
MARRHRLISGLKALFHRSRVEAELDDELRHYLDAAAAQRRRDGLSDDEAWRRARADLGSLDAVKDHTRDAGWETAVEQLWRDLRYAARTLRKAPAFSAVVVLTLTLGIGANTAIFSAVSAVMLRALPVQRPHELVALTAAYRDGAEPFSYSAFRRIAAEGSTLIDAAAASTARRDAIAVDGPPEPVDVKWVSGNYFTSLGVAVAVGRPLVAADDPGPPGRAVAVLSDAFWVRRFGRDPAAVGRSVQLRGATFVIIGITSPGFAGETPGENVDLWLPISSQPNAPAWLWAGHSTTWLSVLARLRPGVDLPSARAGLEPVYERLRADIAADTDSADYRRAVLESRLAVSGASGGGSRLRNHLAAPLTVLMAIAFLVLLVACANIANLMLTRAAARRRELAMCLALGAGRGRLLRQGMVEALILAALGAAGGFVVALWGTSALSTLLTGVLPVALDLRPDARVLMFAGLSAGATAVLFGLLPALATTRLDSQGVFRRVGARRGASRIPFGRTLVVAQVAVSLVLVVTAGLFVRSLMTLNRVELGFDPTQVVLFRIGHTADAGLPGEVRQQIYRAVLDRAASVSGVSGASGSRTGLLSSETWRNVIAVESGAPAERPLRSNVNAVSPGYFEVTRIALLGGRGFTDLDREHAPDVAVVNDAFARRFLGARPLGRRVGLCTSESCEPSSTRMMEVVGIAEDAKYSSLEAPAPPLLYVPLAQSGQNLGEIQVRATGELSTILATLYRSLAGADRRLSIVGMTTAHDRVDASLAVRSAVAGLSSTFGLLALAIAGVGLFGLVAYTTAERTQEIGVRMALGARGRDVRSLVLGETFRLVAIGAGVGLAAALALSRLMSGLLYGIEAHDPAAFSLSLGLLILVALLAGYGPVTRAAGVDPVQALRNE